jgi:hypothetical protein
VETHGAPASERQRPSGPDTHPRSLLRSGARGRPRSAVGAVEGSRRSSGWRPGTYASPRGGRRASVAFSSFPPIKLRTRAQRLAPVRPCAAVAWSRAPKPATLYPPTMEVGDLDGARRPVWIGPATPGLRRRGLGRKGAEDADAAARQRDACDQRDQAPATVGVEGAQGEEGSTGATGARRGERERLVVRDGWDSVS